MVAALSAYKQRKKIYNMQYKIQYYFLCTSHFSTFFFSEEEVTGKPAKALKKCAFYSFFAKQFGSEALVLPKAIAVH